MNGDDRQRGLVLDTLKIRWTQADPKSAIEVVWGKDGRLAVTRKEALVLAVLLENASRATLLSRNEGEMRAARGRFAVTWTRADPTGVVEVSWEDRDRLVIDPREAHVLAGCLRQARWDMLPYES